MRLYEDLLTQLQEEFERVNAQMALLSDIDHEILSLDKPLDKALVEICELTKAAAAADLAAVFFPAKEELVPVRADDDDVQSLKPLLATQAGPMGLPPNDPSVIEDGLPESLRALCHLPIAVGNETFCLLVLAWGPGRDPRRFGREFLAFSRTVSTQIGIMVERFLAERRSTLQSGLVDLFFDEGLRPSACWRLIVGHMARFLPDWSPLRIEPPPKVQLLSYSEGDRHLRIIGTQGDEMPGTEVRVDSSVCGMLVEDESLPYVCVNPRDHSGRYKGFLMVNGDSVPQSELAVPVRHQGATIGVLNLEHPAPNVFLPQHKDAIVSASDFLGPFLAALRSRYERQRSKEIAILYTMNHLLTRVASTYQHLLGQPLMNIRLTLEELQRELAEQGRDVRSMLRDLATQVDRVHASSDRFCEALPRFIRYGPVNVSKAIERAISIFPVQKLEREEEISITVHGDASVRDVYASELLQEHIFNLVNNSLYAVRKSLAGESADKGRIDIKVTRAEIRDKLQQPTASTLVEICVSDNGTGAPAGIEGQIGTPGFTTKKREGTGYGISAATEYAQSLGGDLRLSNRPSKGFAATLVLEEYSDFKHGRRSEDSVSAAGQSTDH